MTFFGTASPRNPNERWALDSDPNIPIENEMAVVEAEQKQSDI